MKEMTVLDARVNFSIRSSMFPAKLNYSSDPKNSAELWQCSSCMSGKIDSMSHILVCDAYADLRKDRDINNNTDLVNYMKSVLIIRDKLDLIK